MPAKKKEETKKRIKPVVEVVEEKPEVTEETENVLTEPDFSSSPEDSPSSEEITTDEAETEGVVEVVEEEPSLETKEVEEPKDNNKESTSVKQEHKMGIKTILIITVISALVAAFVSGGVYVYLNGVSELKSNVGLDKEKALDTTPEVTVEPTPTPKPTEEPVSDDLTTYSIKVLNGSGEIGAAGRGSDVIEDGGFVVADTGNADNYDFTKTVVQYKDGTKKADLSALVKALEKKYTVEVSKDLLKTDSDYDFVVTVGTD